MTIWKAATIALLIAAAALSWRLHEAHEVLDNASLALGCADDMKYGPERSTVHLGRSGHESEIRLSASLYDRLGPDGREAIFDICGGCSWIIDTPTYSARYPEGLPGIYEPWPDSTE